jgi:hypothetical protein
VTNDPGRRWLVACDLDQTLIYSRRAFRLPPGTPEPPVRVVEVYDGAAASFVTATAAADLQQLASDAVVVPVTTRTVEQYRRIDLGFAVPHAVVANGGTLLIGGQPDREWAAAVAQRLRDGGASLPEVRALAEQVADPSWVRLLRIADGLFIYLVAHDRTLIPDLSALEVTLTGLGWTVSVQGRKVYLVPVALTKQAGVDEVVRRTGATAVAAAGDSLLDREMLLAADVAVRPAHGELHDAGWTAPHLQVTDAPGLLGGEQVVETVAAVARVTVA